MNSFFVTATDTNAGKTVVTTALVNFLRFKGITAVPFKPVQTGGIADTEFALEHNKIVGKKEDFYSYSFENPCSPHLASEIEGKAISIKKIVADYTKLAKKYDCVIVEGAGGIMVPLGKGKFVLDIIVELNLPVMLVIANKLGAINQALLSIDKLRSVGFCPDWLVFNDVAQGDESILSDNVRIVKELSGIEKVIRIPFMQEFDIAEVLRVFSLGDNFGFTI